MKTLLIVLVTAAVVSSEDNDCRSDAECIKLSECPKLDTYIDRLHTTNPRYHEYFMRRRMPSMTCGFDRMEPKVCCAGKFSKKNLDNHRTTTRRYKEKKVIVPDEQVSGSDGMTIGPRIRSGEDAADRQFPFQVSLHFYNGTHFCSGSVLNEEHVLTAAHCIYGKNPEDLIIYAGTINIKKPNWIHRAVSFKIHELYSHESYVPDIALIKIKPRFKFSNLVTPFQLPRLYEDLRAGTLVNVTGWGNLESINSASPDHLQRALIYVTDPTLCPYISTICAYDPYYSRGSCYGDSGGPLSIGNKVYGVASYIRNRMNGMCGSTEYPTVYTKTSFYADWIYRNTAAPEKKRMSSVKVPSECGNFQMSRKQLSSPKSTDLSDFPWLVLLEYDTPYGEKKVSCGGVLISKRHVLTTAQCVVRLENERLSSVRVGEYDTNTDQDCSNYGDCMPIRAISIEIEERIVHEKYGTEGQHLWKPYDIAVLKLVKDVTESRFIQPICLPSKDQEPQGFNVAGWGRRRKFNEMGASSMKLRSYLSSVSPTTCKSRYSKMANDQVCAGGDLQEACIADLGGPLMSLEARNYGTRKMTVYGMLTVPTCMMNNEPGVFTKILPYKDWILEQME